MDAAHRDICDLPLDIACDNDCGTLCCDNGHEVHHGPTGRPFWGHSANCGLDYSDIDIDIDIDDHDQCPRFEAKMPNRSPATSPISPLAAAALVPERARAQPHARLAHLREQVAAALHGAGRDAKHNGEPAIDAAIRELWSLEEEHAGAAVEIIMPLLELEETTSIERVLRTSPEWCAPTLVRLPSIGTWFAWVSGEDRVGLRAWLDRWTRNNVVLFESIGGVNKLIQARPELFVNDAEGDYRQVATILACGWLCAGVD